MKGTNDLAVGGVRGRFVGGAEGFCSISRAVGPEYGWPLCANVWAFHFSVTPAKAGVQCPCTGHFPSALWIPAFAGMTMETGSVCMDVTGFQPFFCRDPLFLGLQPSLVCCRAVGAPEVG